MDNLNYVLFICMAVPLGLSLFLLEHKARQVILYILLGISCCLFISEVNQHILKLFDNDVFYVTTIFTPITEEVIKALPLLFFAYAVSADRIRLLNISLAMGLGFAILENIIILIDDIQAVTVLWALGRGFASSLMHSVCTAMVGYGLSFIFTRKKLFVPGTFSLLFLAITVHAIFNCLIQSDYPWLGLILPMLCYIPIVIFSLTRRKKQTEKANNIKTVNN